MDDDGAAYEWCLNLTGWVSLSDGCAGQYNGSQHHQRSTADWPETQAAARAAAAEAEAAWAAAAAAAERAAAATTKILAYRRRGHRLKIFLACGALTAWRLAAQRTFAVGRRAAKSRCEFLQVLIARPRKR